MSESVSAVEATGAKIAAQKRRNVWLALALVAFVVIVGVTTAVRIQETDFSGGDHRCGLGFRSLSSLLVADVVGGIQSGFTMLIIALSLVTGLMLASITSRSYARF